MAESSTSPQPVGWYRRFVEGLDPGERLGELLFGLIMVLTFTLGAEIELQGNRGETRGLLIAALGCNARARARARRAPPAPPAARWPEAAREQHYNVAGARSQATMLTLAAIALILPAAYRAVAGAEPLTGQVAGDGRSDWLKGVQLLAVYVILGLAYFFAPVPPPG